MSNSRYTSVGMIMFLITASVAFTRVNEFGLSATMTLWQDQLGINSAQAGMGLSVIFIGCGVFSLLGGSIVNKMGVKNSYTLALSFISIGLLMNFIVTNYAMFLAARIIFSAGMGLSIAFFGGATKEWMNLNQQNLMNTLNTLFPQLGSLLAFFFLVPLTYALGSWGAGIGFWGILTAIFTVWWAFSKPKTLEASETSHDGGIAEENYTTAEVYRMAWSYKETKLLALSMCFSFANFATFNTFNAQFLGFIPGVDLATASLMSSLNPLFAIVGAFVCMAIIKKTGTRKATSIAGFLLTGLGTLMCVFFVGTAVGFVGIAVFGFGMAMRMPGVYQMTIEMPGATPKICSAINGFLLGFGFFIAFLSPMVAGAIIDSLGGRNLENLGVVMAWSSIFCLGGAVCIALCKEYGPKAMAKRAALAEQSSGKHSKA
ncbi:MAG TPA: MFS transporter [Anaerovoracaceae bacterium]|nr:MFS transporter [Anaerovoracaceae bacterium]